MRRSEDQNIRISEYKMIRRSGHTILLALASMHGVHSMAQSGVGTSLATEASSLIGTWTVAGTESTHLPTLVFSKDEVTIDGMRSRYSLTNDSLVIFTAYVDHPGDGNSHGVITKLTADSLVIKWSTGEDRNTYIRLRKTLR